MTVVYAPTIGWTFSLPYPTLTAFSRWFYPVLGFLALPLDVQTLYLAPLIR
jgi:hypothetical protein